MNHALQVQLRERVKVGRELINTHLELTVAQLSRLTGFSDTSSLNVLRRLCESSEAHEVKVKNRLCFRLGPAARVEPSVERVARHRVDSTPYAGVDWSDSVIRPGCQDFLLLPSRVADRELPYRTPIYGCAPSGARHEHR